MTRTRAVQTPTRDQTHQVSPELPRPVLFGAAYYHEYQPQPRLDADLDLMAKAGFSLIRVGESTWSTWEPENGVFDLDWLQPVLDGAHGRGMGVILGTPTYAVPPWLARMYPEIAGERATGERIPWGARQEADFTHPAFRFHAERVIRAVVGRYAGHPAVIGVQVDNEPGLELLHNHAVFQAFVDHLRGTYGDVENLNREWGLTYWSHRLSRWSDLWLPDGNAQPQYDLAWRRFQARLTTDFVAWQAGIVRELVGREQFVTTCLSYTRPAVDDRALTAPLDVAAGNLYYAMQDALAVPGPGDAPQGWRTSGAWSVFASADRMYAMRQEPFLVTETNAATIGGPALNDPAYDGQWRQVAWAMVARGARSIEYWHWHTLHWGAETYWGGVLPHDQVPGRVFEEIARIGAELKVAEEDLAGLRPDAQVGMVHSNASRWALEFQPFLADGSGPDPRSYDTVLEAFYRGAFDSGAGVRLVHDAQLCEADRQVADPGDVASALPVLIVPALYVASDHLLDWLCRYAEAGGHLVLGPRTGYADEEARARVDVKPARLADAAGVRYQEYSNLAYPLTVRSAHPSAPLPADAKALRWAEGLIPTTGEVLARYEHPHFGGWAAMVTHSHGEGRITTVGTVPNPAMAAWLVDWLVPPDGWRQPASSSLRVTSATSGTGRQLRFVHNWSWQPVSFRAPARVRDVLTGMETERGGDIELGAWDVHVLSEE